MKKLFLIGICAIMGYGCDNLSPETITLITGGAEEITTNSVTVSVQVSSVSAVNRMGVMYSKTSAFESSKEAVALNIAKNEKVAISGLEPGTVYYCKAFASDRNGNTVYGNTVTFTTENNSLSLSETNMVISSAGGTEQFGVNSDVTWNVSSDQSWCSILTSSGNGNGNVNFRVEANTGTNERTAIITVTAGSQSQQVMITQQGMAFTLSVSSNIFNVGSDAGSNELTISSNTSWSVSSNQNWCTVSTASGNGNQKITFTISENTGTGDRTAIISVVAGLLRQEIVVVQRFKSLTLSLSSNSFSVGSEGNRYNVNVMSNTSWTASSNQTWCSVTQTSGNGNATLSFDISANTSTDDRVATITISVNASLMQTVTVHQQGVDKVLLVSSNSFTMAATAGSNNFSITCNQSWSVSSSQSWCTVSPASGANNGNVTFTLSANTTTSPRVAIITVSSGALVQQIAVTQDAAFIPELSVSSEKISMAAVAGSGSVGVTSNQNWTVASNQAWCTVSPLSGANNGTINFVLTANTSISIRTATLTVTAGSLTKQVTIEQQGTDKTLIVSSNSFNMAASAGSNSFTVTSNQSWTVSSNQTWCTVNPTSGSNNSSVTFTLAENTTTSLRIAVISVSGGGITQQITVTQQATIIPVLSVSSEKISVAATAGSGTVEVTSNQNWTVASNQTWCTVSPQSGANDGTINFSYSANTSTSIRTAILTLTAGSLTKQVTIEQQGTDRTLLVSSNSFDMSASAGNNSFTITSNQNWTVASNQTWCTVSPVSGSNNGSITFTVAENTETSSRIAIITVTAGTLSQQVTVTQQAAAPFLNVSSEKYTLAATAGNGTVNITSNQSWTVVSNQPWCSVTPSSGSNNGTINFTVTANEITSERTALITITTGSLTKQVTIEQQAADKTLLVSSNTFTMPASAGNNNFTITSNQSWTVASNQVWCTVSPTSGSNNGVVTFTLLANTTTSSRVAVITVTAGTLTQQVTVTQQAATGILEVSPTSLIFNSDSKPQIISVSSNQNWTVSSNQSWCSVSPTSGMNNGSVTVSVQENTSITERTATITFTAGVLQKQVSVTQHPVEIIPEAEHFITLNFNILDWITIGREVVVAQDYEITVSDAAVYIYKDNGVGYTTPEAMAYLPVADLGYPRSLTMKTTPGNKKIFVAFNVGHSITPLLDNNGFTIARLDTGIVYNSTFSALNNVLYSSTSDIQLSPQYGLNGGSAGLIRTLAGGSMNTWDGILYSTNYPTYNNMYCLMTNWDGPDIEANWGMRFPSTCLFTVLPNISKEESKQPWSPNNFTINVQRAYAKISLRITADGYGVNTSNSYVGPYESSEADGSKGRFTPWQVSGQNIWSLGGINKQTFPFQQFGKDFAGAIYPNQVLSPNWRWATGDSIIKGDAANSDMWYTNYDNTRVFGNQKIYLTAANTVTNVRNVMTTAGNYLALSPADGNWANLKFAMCTENGIEYPQRIDKASYVIVGGTYAPENVVTGVLKPIINSYPADIGWNYMVPVVGIGPLQGYGSDTYPTLIWASGALDTLYYLDRVFIWGSDNLAKYIAWQLRVDLTLTAPTVNNPTISAYINARLDNNELYGYYQGQCWYYEFVRDLTVAKGPQGYDEVLVRRNHVYNINITKILGPGIADPNNILNGNGQVAADVN